MRLSTVAGVLFIIPIVDFALAAPVLAQEKCQACAEIANIPENPVTVFGKRGGLGEIEEVGGRYIENWFAKPEQKPAASVSDHGKAPSSSITESDYVLVDAPPSGSVSSTKPGEDNTSKGKAKESRHIFGTARDGLDAA
jgi:hypothetical protein